MAIGRLAAEGGPVWLPPLLKLYTQRHPEVALDLHFLDSELAYQGVVDGTLEMAIVTLAPHPVEQLQVVELWRDRLIESDDAVQDWIAQHPATDTQQLRALVRQARKDAPPPDKAAVSQGLAPRQGRAYREIFQLVKATLKGQNASDEPPATSEDSDD